MTSSTNPCTNTFFGGDPAPKQRKICQAPAVGWQSLALERGSFTLEKSQIVRYGLRDSWVQKYAVGTTPCTNDFFALDPLRSVRKECQLIVGMAAGSGQSAPVLPPSATAEWTFESVAGTSAPSTIGSGAALMLSAGTSVVRGLSGWGLKVTGSGSPAAAATSGPVIDTATSFSVSGWIRFDKFPDCWSQTLASQDGTTVSGFSFGTSAPCSGRPAYLVVRMLPADADTSAPGVAIEDPQPTETNRWYHLVGVRDAAASTLRMYVDGNFVGSVAVTSQWSARGPFALGRDRFSAQNRSPCYCTIDNVRVYSRALTSTEVMALNQLAR